MQEADFHEVADEFINLANELSEDWALPFLSATFMYAAARYNAFFFLESDGDPENRDDATRSKGELAGAVAPDDALMSKLVQQRRQNPPVLVYCYHGHQSRDLCAFLSQFGLQQVYSLAGGWEALQCWDSQKPK